MKLTQSPKINLNYAAKIIKVTDFTNHPNPNCTRLKCVHVGAYSIAVSIDTEPGTYIYFPIECQIVKEYLAANNLFRNKSSNADSEQSGFFEDNGRVKAIKLQGYPSEGFIMPVESLYKWLDFIGLKGEVITNLEEGLEFDCIGDRRLCKKYINKQLYTRSVSTGKTKKVKGINKIIDDQFRLHYDTVLIKKCPWVIQPDDIISITTKVHGTSGISANVLCIKPLNWKDKIANWLSDVPTTKYDDIWSSRKVIKNQFYNAEVSPGFYGCDVWGEAHKVLKPYLTKGLTLYYEIIGYLPTGKAIQSLGGQDFDYGYEAPASNEEYKYEKHFGIRIYRITYTNPDGIVYEFSALQVQQWCLKHGLTPVTQLYYGYASDLYPDIVRDENWSVNFIQKLSEDKSFYMEELSPECNNEVPHEGVVIKVENGKSEAFKLKCFRFLQKESSDLDKGNTNIEDSQNE